MHVTQDNAPDTFGNLTKDELWELVREKNTRIAELVRLKQLVQDM